MQIGVLNSYKMFQVGTNYSTAWTQKKSQHHLKNPDMYGAQCKVTISREGKKIEQGIHAGNIRKLYEDQRRQIADARAATGRVKQERVFWYVR